MSREAKLNPNEARTIIYVVSNVTVPTSKAFRSNANGLRPHRIAYTPLTANGNARKLNLTLAHTPQNIPNKIRDRYGVGETYLVALNRTKYMSDVIAIGKTHVIYSGTTTKNRDREL